ncbi:RDD family protein [Corynebacterium occultum]|uniref:RDD family protein n=1 Tax=Corynebacterium occultum TaxID=2675219 RepID=A0A6B8VR07_9CORY|nr:RDD family protein [Corynebacterium occultum]QGU06543.1 RDD family protein [Corynebacterium occultum]
MNTSHGELYSTLGLDPADGTEELRTLIMGRDAQLENQGHQPQDPRRQQLQTAYAVLGDESRRRIYDHALASGRNLAWHEIEYLGNFGRLPEISFQQTPPQAQAGPQQTPFSTQTQYQMPYPSTPGMPSGFAASHPLAQTASPNFPGDPTKRPSAGTRLLMLLVDGFIFSVAAGILGMAFFWSETLMGLVWTLAFLLYFLGLEFKTGATPAKHLFGYEVRDLNTGGRPSLLQSGKRQLWRLASIVPGIGWLVSLIAAIYLAPSINGANSYLGKHDRWAGTEVTRKR